MPVSAPLAPSDTDIHGDPKGIHLGRVLFGPNANKRMYLSVSDVSKHLLAVGSTGSGKTTALKGVGESLIARSTPIIAIDVTGDLLGLLIPAGSAAVYRQLGVHEPELGADDWATGAIAADWLARHIYPRFVTPCGDHGERLSVTPLIGRPQNYEVIKGSGDGEGNTDLDIQADAIAVNLMGKMGLQKVRMGEAPSIARSSLTEVVKLSWDKRVDLSGLEGLKQFRFIMNAATQPAVPESVKSAMDNLIEASSGGLEKQWYAGAALDLDDLLTAPAGRTPVVVISVAHLMASQPDAVPFVVCQILHQVMNYVVGKGNDAPGRIRLAVLLDELCGDRNFPIMPPGNRQSPSGNAIHRVLRVGRHYSTTLFGGTQNAGDIDYKSYSNFNLRFIGRQSTSIDASRSIYGVDIDDERAAYLKQQIARARPGNLFVVRPNGQWEPIAFRWIGSMHSKIPKQQMHRVYEAGFLTRRGVQDGPSIETRRLRAMQQIRDIAEAYRDALGSDVVQRLDRLLAS